MGNRCLWKLKFSKSRPSRIGVVKIEDPQKGSLQKLKIQPLKYSGLQKPSPWKLNPSKAECFKMQSKKKSIFQNEIPRIVGLKKFTLTVPQNRSHLFEVSEILAH